MSEERPRRRLPIRLLTLGEIVAVAAVVIAGLGYWDSHRERDQEAREKAAAAQAKKAEAAATARRQVFILTGQPDSSGDRIRLSPVNPEQVIQTQALTFPTPVREDDVQTTGNPRIEKSWFDGGLKKALKVRGGEDGRVPVGVATVYIEDGLTKSDRSIYLVGYSLHDRMLKKDEVRLEGLSLARRGVGGDLQRAVDALWEAGG